MASNGITHSPEAQREKQFVGLTSVVAALFLTGIKIVVGLSTGSLGILSEAAHSGLDLVAAVMTLFAVRVSGRPADREHTYGHGKVENLSALGETALLLITCVWIVYEALRRLLVHHVEVDASIWAFIIMGTSIVVDVSRSRALMRVAKKYDSQALEADALHFSTDIWSSAVVLVGLALVRLSQALGAPWLVRADAVTALGVAGIVIYISIRLGRKTIGDLLDAVPAETSERVQQAVAAVPGVLEARQVRVRRAGPESFADVTVSVSRNTAFERAHEIAEAAETAVRGVLPNSDVVVHVDPVSGEHEGVSTTVRLLAARHGLGAHGIRILDAVEPLSPTPGKPNPPAPFPGKEGGEEATPPSFSGKGAGGLGLPGAGELGSRRRLELHLEVDAGLSLEAAHRQASEFEREVRAALPGIEQVVSHIEPAGDLAGPAGRARPTDEQQVVRTVEALPAELGMACRPHDISVQRVAGELGVTFHCDLDGGASIADAHHVSERLESALRARIPSLGRVVIHVEPGEAGESVTRDA